MKTIAPATYDTLIAKAKGKANLVDQPVAVVIWDIKGDDCAFELVVCRKGYAGAEDMSGVNALLEQHEDAEIVEIVGPTY
jgi:hypothetical protein